VKRALVAALLVVLVACGGGKGDGAATTTTASTIVGGREPMPYYLPSFLPFGFKVVQGGVVPEGPARPAFAIALGQPDGDRRFKEVVLVLVTATASDRVIGPDQQAAMKSVDINGTAARLFESGTIGTNVDWFSNGIAVAVLGPLGTAALVTDVAKRVRLGADVASTSLDGAPDDYEVIAETRFEDREPEEARSLSVATEKGAALAVTVTRTTLPLVFVASGGDLVRPGKVRGRDALISTRVRQLEGARVVQSTIVWRERDDIALTITGSTPLDSLQPIAEGMAVVSEAEWRAAVPT
jgi:hypothetical protein